MARVSFTENLQRHVRLPEASAAGESVRDVMDAVFLTHPTARGYVLDEQGAVRKHIVIFVDGKPIADRVGLTDVVGPAAEVFVMQALSGG